MIIYSLVLSQYQRVTDGQTDGHMDRLTHMAPMAKSHSSHKGLQKLCSKYLNTFSNQYLGIGWPKKVRTVFLDYLHVETA